MTACATNPTSESSSPLTPRIDQIVAEKRDYPRLEDFPAAPVNVPDAAYVRSAVGQLEQSQSALDTQVASIDWALTESPEQYVAQVRERLASDQVTIPTADTPAEIEAFADSLRQRAKAPPPIDRSLR